MNDIETTIVTLTVSDDANTAHIATTSDHSDSAGIESDEVYDLTSLDINLHGVVDLDSRVGVTDGASVMSDEVWDTLSTKLHALDLGKLVAGFGFGDAVDGEATLGVVDKTEVFAGLFDGDYVHEAGWVGRVCADLTVDLDETLHNDRLDFPRKCQ